MARKENQPKEKKNIFQQLEEQQEKLKKLKLKKEKQIKKIIFNSFDFLTEEEVFVRFSILIGNNTFLENIKNFILKEMERIELEDKKKKEEAQKNENKEGNKESEG